MPHLNHKKAHIHIFHNPAVHFGIRTTTTPQPHNMRSILPQKQSGCFGTIQPRASRQRRVNTCQCSIAGSNREEQVTGASRREALLLGIVATTASAALPLPANAGFKKELKKRKIPLEEYSLSELNGLRYYDNEDGRGKQINTGDKVSVHFDCKFKGVDAVSSRYARTLGGNRTIAEPFGFVAGETVNVTTKKAGDTAGGLFAGGSGPKPPPALSTAVIGMKAGGRRTVYVDKPELGYEKGNQEIPPGAAFELQIEVLSVLS